MRVLFPVESTLARWTCGKREQRPFVIESSHTPESKVPTDLQPVRSRKQHMKLWEKAEASENER